MWDFEHGKAGAHFEIAYTIPSACAAQLATGAADIGIIPAAGYAGIPDLLIVPGVAIAARQAVRSILLVSKVPLSDIRSVALDSSSLTSVALMKVLFSKWLGGERKYEVMTPDLDGMLARCDAGLLIGDPALQVNRSLYYTYDLAEEWVRHTELPFVFAFWAISTSAVEHWDTGELAQIFQKSRDRGLEPDHLGTIATQWAPRLGIAQSDAKDYLTKNIHYFLDTECLRGLQLFFQYALELGVVPRVPDLRFIEIPKALVT
jgi:chorismate dehydratase